MSMTPTATAGTAKPPEKPEKLAAGGEAIAAERKIAAPAPPPEEAEDEGEVEEPSHFGRFVLFNALPSSIVSGVVHFVAFLALALLTMPPPQVNETLAINAQAAEETKKVDDLQEEKLEMKLAYTVSDERSESVQQVLQDVVAATDTPTVGVDIDAAPIHVDLSDFGERTAPKSDMMATDGTDVSSGLS